MASKQGSVCIHEVKHFLNNWFHVWAKRHPCSSLLGLETFIINTIIIIIVIIIIVIIIIIIIITVNNIKGLKCFQVI